ncbi:flippase, partial [Candidatus Parcubacteria bacterium]|nr:flippase [Candidatus Parcubacteria bacterium]
MKITSIAKNTSYFTAALVLQKVLSFTYFTILARNLVPEQLGKYYLAISFTTIFAIFIDLGMANVLTREVAKAKDKATAYLGAIMAIKLPLALLSITAAILTVNILDYPQIIRHLVYLSCVPMVLDSFTATFFAIMRGFHNLKWESIGAVMFQVIAMSVGIIALKMGYSLRWIMGAQVTASIIYFLYSSVMLRIKYQIRLWPKPNKTLIKFIVTLSIPFGLYGIFQRAYMYLDTVLLSQLAGDYDVGLYQIAFKIVFALQFLPLAFIASLYPAFASYWRDLKTSEQPLQRGKPAFASYWRDIKYFPLSLRRRGAGGEVAQTVGDENPSQLVITFERAMNYLLIISMPISVGIIVLADKIIMLFKAEYINAVLPLQIIIASVVFIFLNYPIGALLNACDQQKRNTINMAIVLLASIIINIIIIPIYAAVGASITVVITNALMFTLGMYYARRIIKYRAWKI